MVWKVCVAGLVFGALSRVEEVADGFSMGISSDSAWVGAAFAAGALVRRWWAGPLVLSAANGGYYAWIAVTQSGVPLASVAGPVERWVVLGLSAGLVFGLAGTVWAVNQRRKGSCPRSGWTTPLSAGAAAVTAALPLAAVLIAEGAGALRGGALTDGIGLVVGLALAPLTASGARGRAVATVVAVLLLAAALAGITDRYLP